METATVILKRLLVVLFLLILANQGFAQSYKVNENWIVGGNAGAASFFGDLSVYDKQPIQKLTEESDLTFGLLFGKELSSTFTVKFSYIDGKMKGSNPDLLYYFSNHFNEIAVSTDVSLSKIIFPFNNSRYNVYINAGLGSLQSHPVKRLISDDLTDDGPGTISPVKASSSFVILTGLGCNYSINDNLKANIELACRSTSNDLVDGHIGSTKINDYYSFLSIGVTYTLNPGRKYYSYDYPRSFRYNKRKHSNYSDSCMPFN